jgi:hypothetical protein
VIVVLAADVRLGCDPAVGEEDISGGVTAVLL